MRRDRESSFTWFPEPAGRDDTYAWRGESPASWLTRSTLGFARGSRAFLNRNLSVLPERCSEGLYPRLRSEINHRGAFFELVVARTLQVLGASITCEPGNPVDGTRIDFMAHFPDAVVGVEATSPLFDRYVGERDRNRAPLMEMVRELVPNGWAVGVGFLPGLGPADSKKGFRTAIKEMLDVPPPASDEEEREVRRRLPEGEIRLTLLPKTTSWVSEEADIAWDAAAAAFDDSGRIIRRAVEGKRRQARNVKVPVFVAVDANGMVANLEDFDEALFGHSTQFLDPSGTLHPPTFEADGLFAGGEGKPTISGVLAFTDVGFFGCREPVLYLHPRFGGSLPKALLRLEVRTMGPDGVSISPARNSGFLGELGFVAEP